MMTKEQKKAYNRAHYAAHAQEFTAKALERYRQKLPFIDRAAKSAYDRAYRAANPEKVKRTPEAARAHQIRRNERYASDPEFRQRFLERQRLYAQIHPDMIRKTNLKRNTGLLQRITSGC